MVGIVVVVNIVHERIRKMVGNRKVRIKRLDSKIEKLYDFNIVKKVVEEILNIKTDLFKSVGVVANLIGLIKNLNVSFVFEEMVKDFWGIIVKIENDLNWQVIFVDVVFIIVEKLNDLKVCEVNINL